MNSLFKRILPVALPLLLILVLVNCDDDDEKSTFVKPEVVEVSPVEALIGSSVIVKGDQLNNVVKVKFGNIDAADFAVSANEITATVPDGLEEGETNITVFYKGASSTNLGPSDAALFTVLYAPVATGVDPLEVKPGFQAVITGDYLKRTSEVKVGDLEASFEATQNDITITVPTDATSGDVEISITTPGGTTTVPFTVAERTPELYAFTPAGGGKTGAEITVTGLFFMDVQSLELGSTEIVDFEVVSDTEIKFNIPAGVSSSKVTVTTALGTVTSEADLTVIEIPFVIYDEGLHQQMQNWSWGGDNEFGSTTVAKTGTKSYARTYNDAWSGSQLHHGSLNLAPYSTVKFFAYGGTGTTGKKLQVAVNGGASVQFTLTDGVWTEVTIELSALGSPATLDNFLIQDVGNTAPNAPFTVYIDRIELIE